ncbi:hypothetical protein V8J88_11485 [Massilia sp. W12]|uniref:hypothetical protein n=1 Tax=Massilia sp. W12 TaxID=3126507 RepID=UPI0030CB7790
MEGMTGLVAKINGPLQLIGFILLLMAFLLWRSKSSPALWKKTWPLLLALALAGSLALGGWQMWLSAQVELQKNAKGAAPTPQASPPPSSSAQASAQTAKARNVKDQAKVEINQSSPAGAGGQTAEVDGVSGSATVTIKQGVGNGK